MALIRPELFPPSSYANIIFSVFIGMALGDPFPDWMSTLGIFCIIGSGVIISLYKRNKVSHRIHNPEFTISKK